jgi:hypothetical protein
LNLSPPAVALVLFARREGARKHRTDRRRPG